MEGSNTLPRKSNASKKKSIQISKEGNILKSSKYLMSFVLDEYSKEIARSEKLDGKGIALVTLLIGFLTLTFPVINFSFVINSFYTKDGIMIRLGTICVILLLISFAFIIYTLVTTLKIFKIREYKRFNTENAKDRNIQYESEEMVATSLIDTYVKDINNNQIVNNDKAGLIEKSYNYVIITVILILLTSVLTIVGGVIMDNELKTNLEKIKNEMKITNAIEKQNIVNPIEMKKSIDLKHSVFVKDSKPIKESMD